MAHAMWIKARKWIALRSYRVAMRDVLVSEPPGTFAYEDITGLPWIEIDYPSDLLRAERTILPRLSRAATEDEEADTNAA